MNTPTIRQELHAFIDTISERRLPALKPLLADLAENDPEWVIETDLTDEEHKLIAEGMRDYENDLSSFTSLETIKARLRATGKLKN